MTALSIIIAAHDAADYLGRTLERLAAEVPAGADVEVLLIDDASTDSTGAIAAEHAGRHAWLRVLRVEFRNVGRVRQFGVQQARGRHITFLDSDDAFMDGALAWLLATLAAQQPDALLAPLREVSDAAHAEPIAADLAVRPISTAAAIDAFLDHRRIQGHLIGKCFSRALLASCEIPPLSAYEDLAVLPELLLGAQRIVLASDAFYLYLKRPGSLSSRARGWPRLAEQVAALERVERALATLVPAHRLGVFWVELAHALSATPDGAALLPAHPAIGRRVAALSLPRFLLDPAVRTSLKRKLLKLGALRRAARAR